MVKECTWFDQCSA